ncbi:MAG: hypothetical protein Q9166_006684 [cf. Caloplaca sp. 2 TL-2023]
MCFTGIVRRLPDGRLVQEQPRQRSQHPKPTKDKQKKKTALLPTNVKAATTTTSTPPPSQHALPTLTKKVSFPNNLTRGRGRSYTPPEDETVVRFSTSLVRGEGTGYNDRSVKCDTSDIPASRRRASPQPTTSLSVHQSISTKNSNDIAIDTRGRLDAQAATAEFDIASESDESFTDLVSPIKVFVSTEPELRRYTFGAGHHCHLDHRSDRHGTGHRHRRPARKAVSQGPSESMQGNVSGSRGGYLIDNNSIAAGFDTTSARRNSISGRYTSFDRADISKRSGTATVPTYNRLGHRLRSNSVDASMLGQSSRPSWPEPLFIIKDSTAATAPGRPNPAFALRKRSNSQNNVQGFSRPSIAKLSKQ